MLESELSAVVFPVEHGQPRRVPCFYSFVNVICDFGSQVHAEQLQPIEFLQQNVRYRQNND